MCVQTIVTSFKTREEIPGEAESGRYLDGMYLEGAAWENTGAGTEGYVFE